MTDNPFAALLDGVPYYDAGLLNDYGGGNVEWWQDYLRAEIGRANDAWRENVLAALAAEKAKTAKLVEEATKILEQIDKSDGMPISTIGLCAAVEEASQ